MQQKPCNTPTQARSDESFSHSSSMKTFLAVFFFSTFDLSTIEKYKCKAKAKFAASHLVIVWEKWIYEFPQNEISNHLFCCDVVILLSVRTLSSFLAVTARNSPPTLSKDNKFQRGVWLFRFSACVQVPRRFRLLIQWARPCTRTTLQI